MSGVKRGEEKERSRNLRARAPLRVQRQIRASRFSLLEGMRVSLFDEPKALRNSSPKLRVPLNG